MKYSIKNAEKANPLVEEEQQTISSTEPNDSKENSTLSIEASTNHL